MAQFSDFDHDMMSRAIDLAYRPQNPPYPNPRVGAVITRNGEIISEGCHLSYHFPHAEYSALEKLNFRAQGSTIYVTLEPCCPFEGKRNPPCAVLIAQSGIERCVISYLHPIGSESKGVEILNAAGVTVEHGLLSERGESIVKGLFHVRRTGKPYVISKWGMTADGLIAPPDRTRGAISGSKAFEYTHQLRHQYDGVLIGIGTAKNDNPILDCRLAGFRHPVRVVIDPRLELPLTHHLANPDALRRTLLIHSQDAQEEKKNALVKQGVELVMLPDKNGTGIAVEDILSTLMENNIYSVLIEGGSSIHGRFFDAKAINEVAIFLAPKLMGGKEGLNPIGGAGTASISTAYKLTDMKISQLGTDLLITGFPTYE